jgi:hypothetical protein
MIVDFEAREGEWFPFFESKLNERGEVVYSDPVPDAGRVCVRSLVPFFEDLHAKRKRRFDFVLNPQTRSMERVGYFEEATQDQAKKERDDAWDYSITGLEGFFDKSGNAIECTRENKLRLMSLPVFDRFIARCLQLLSESGVRASEEARKNG